MKSKKLKVFSVSGYEHDVNWIDNIEIVNKIENADIVVFPGGADVDPKLYDNKRLSGTYTSVYADERDLDAWSKMKPNQLAVGICRGAQLLTVLNGGMLIQDVDNHAIGYTHTIVENKIQSPLIKDPKLYKVIETNSLHHQMMYPFTIQNDCYRILYSCPGRCSNFKYDVNSPRQFVLDHFFLNGEPEIVYYYLPNKPKCLAIQGHPEMLNKERALVVESNDLINSILNGTLDVNKYKVSK